jgi:hypothetical protein
MRDHSFADVGRTDGCAWDAHRALPIVSERMKAVQPAREARGKIVSDTALQRSLDPTVFARAYARDRSAPHRRRGR